jgi:hypothetical protein
MTNVRVAYRSGKADDNPTFWIATHDLATGQTFFLTHPVITDDNGTLKLVNMPSSTLINNMQKSYTLMACLNIGDAFQSARITYTYNNAGS